MTGRIITAVLISTLISSILADDCIESYVDLERSLLSNPTNIRSLTTAFYPTNNFPALFVEVRYYINRTDSDNDNGSIPIHPISPLAHTKDDRSDYVFYWATSPVLLLSHPMILEGVSLELITITYHQADIVLSPFCDTLTDFDIRTYINDATTWVWITPIVHVCVHTVNVGLGPSLGLRLHFSWEGCHDNIAI